MPVDHFARFYPAACAGLGLLMAGGVNLLLIRRRLLLRAAATAAAILVAVTAAAASDLGLPGGMTNITVRLLALGLIPFLILGSRWFVSGLSVVVAAAHRPAVRFSLLAFAGVATMVGSIVAYEQDGTEANNEPSEANLLRGHLASIPAEQVQAATDLGTRIVLKEPVGASGESDPVLAGAEDRILRKAHLDEDVIRRGAADDRSNCHGWVFTGGRFLLNAADVELILRENGYRQVSDPRPGDLVVYRGQGRTVAHTAVVRYVSDGQPVLVESKWGELGVFLHAADKSVYGTAYTFHRSARRGHLLAGVGGSRPGPPK